MKVTSINISEIKSNDRFDPKFYFLVNFFNTLEKYSNNKVVKIADIKEKVISGSYINNYTTQEQGIPYLRVGDIKPFSFDENEDDLVYVASDVNDKIKIKENDILIARTQAITDKLGTTSIADSHNSGWATSQHTTRIRVDENKISPFYLLAYLNSKFFKAQTELASYGSTRVEFTHTQINQVRIFLPETKLYNDIIEKVKTIIETNRQSLNLIKEAKNILTAKLSLKQSENNKKYFQTDFSSLKEFDVWTPVRFMPFYADPENELKSKFQTIKLGYFENMQKGDEAGSENYKIYLDKKDTDYAFIRTSDIVNNEIDLFPDYFVSEDIRKKCKQELQAGDILFSKDGKIGQTAIITKTDRVIVASGFVRIRVEKNDYDITPEYIFTVLSTKETGYNPAIRRTVIGTTIPHLQEERLKQINIPVLDKGTMNEISKKVKYAFELKEKRKILINEVLDELNNEYERLKLCTTI